jgi:hypothetical protein
MAFFLESYSFSQSRALIGWQSDQYFVELIAHLYRHAFRPAVSLCLPALLYNKRNKIRKIRLWQGHKRYTKQIILISKYFYVSIFFWTLDFH